MYGTKQMAKHLIDNILDSMKQDIIIIPPSADEKTEAQRVHWT